MVDSPIANPHSCNRNHRLAVTFAEDLGTCLLVEAAAGTGKTRIAGLGPMPDDLAEVLADLAMGSHAVLTLRSLRRVFRG